MLFLRSTTRTESELGGSVDSINSTSTATSNLRQSRRKKGTVTLPGAKITAFSTSIFQRMRAMDDIDFKQIQKSLNPRSNRD